MQLHTVREPSFSAVSVRGLSEDKYNEMKSWISKNLKDSTSITYSDEFYIHIRFGSEKDFNWFYLKYG